MTYGLRDDHAQYIATWLDIMQADRRAVYTAAAKADQALLAAKRHGKNRIYIVGDPGTPALGPDDE